MKTFPAGTELAVLATPGIASGLRALGAGRRRSFTLFEMLIVVLLVGIIAALVGPRVTAIPKRYLVESALSRLRQAINETAMRARASGRGLSLTLDEENSSFAVAALDQTLAGEWVPPSGGTAEDTGVVPGFIEVKASYELGGDFEWFLQDAALSEDGRAVFSFHPNGEAGGPALEFALKGRKFRLDVDRLTGEPLIQELDQ